MVAMLIYKH